MPTQRSITSWKPLLLGALVSIAVCNAAIWAIVGAAGGLGRLRPVSEIPLDAAMYGPTVSASHQNEFLSLLRDAGLIPGEVSGTRALAVQRFVGECVGSVGGYHGGDALELLKAGSSGAPLACGPMGVIFREALALLGFKARLIQLYRSDFSPADTHVLVEAYIDGEWKALDPTFNLTFHTADSQLGVRSIQENLRNRGLASVELEYHGDRRYPARIDEYYVDWRLLFANAYVVSTQATGRLYKLPVLRWLYGPRTFYFGEEIAFWARGHNPSLFLATVGLPSVAGLLLVLCLTRFPRRTTQRSRDGKERDTGSG